MPLLTPEQDTPSAPIVHMFPCLRDNYGFLVHDRVSGETACVDTPDGDEILRQLDLKGWRLTAIWNTHWHPDHTGGNERLKTATGCAVFGPAAEAGRIPGLDTALGDGDRDSLGDHAARILDVPGHTAGHIAYVLDAARLAFVGDTLFALGCGRLFEGTPAQMWASLSRLMTLPDETLIYCAHEYTEANLRFAESVDPANPALHAYGRQVRDTRARNAPTVPTTLGREKAANPFLRAGDSALQAAMGFPGDAVATFGEIRARKDRF